MGLKKLAAKVSEYNARLEDGKARKIKPDHVREIREKLTRKVADLEEEIARTESPDKKARLARKLDVAKEHLGRADWLLKELG